MTQLREQISKRYLTEIYVDVCGKDDMEYIHPNLLDRRVATKFHVRLTNGNTAVVERKDIDDSNHPTIVRAYLEAFGEPDIDIELTCRRRSGQTFRGLARTATPNGTPSLHRR